MRNIFLFYSSSTLKRPVNVKILTTTKSSFIERLTFENIQTIQTKRTKKIFSIQLHDNETECLFSSNSKSRRILLCMTAQCKTIQLIIPRTTSGKRHSIHVPSKDVDLPAHKDVFCICRSSQETYFISPSINGLLRGNQRLIEREYHRLIWVFFPPKKISENADM